MTTARDVPPERLWDRSRQRAYAEIAAVAMDLFLAKGFEETTIEEIVTAAGVSRRSFFRYFGTKEDVVLGQLLTAGGEVLAELERRPADEDVWDALIGALLAVERATPDKDRILAISRLVYGTPSLRARSIEKHLRWYEDLVPEVRRRLGDTPDGALRATAIVGCAITCLDIAGAVWTDEGGVRPLRECVEAAAQAVREPS